MLSGARAQRALAQRLRGARVVVVGHAAGEPRTLLRLLAEVAPPGLRVVCGFAFAGSPLPELAAREDLRIDCWHPTPVTRPLLEQGRVGLLPMRSGQAEAVFAALRPDALLTVVAPARGGRNSFGASAGHAAAAARQARLVIAEVNPAMPTTAGDPGLSTGEGVLLVESEEGLASYSGARADATSAAVARNVLPLCFDGARLQLGIGSVPEALGALVAAGDGPRRVTFYGMGMDYMAEADRRGVTDPDACLLASPELVSPGIWELADGNPRILVEGAERSYNPARLAALGTLVSVNSALLIDLSGQVASEGIGVRPVTGIGGALDFAIAAQASGGFSVFALPSTFGDGSSRIVSSLPTGTPVSVPSHVPDYVVSEWGVAALRGLDRDERATALAAVAHPDHREGLQAAEFRGH